MIPSAMGLSKRQASEANLAARQDEASVIEWKRREDEAVVDGVERWWRRL